MKRTHLSLIVTTAVMGAVVSVTGCTSSAATVSVRTCQFTVSGTLGFLGSSIPISGSGVLSLDPKPAAEWTVTATGPVGNPHALDLVRVGDRIFVRMGPSKHWEDDPADSPGPSSAVFGDPVAIIDTFARSNAVTTVGDEKVGAGTARHLTIRDSTTVYDEWLYEPAGTIARLAFKSDDGLSTAIISCPSWASGSMVRAPAPADRACAQTDAGDLTSVGFLSARWPSGWVAESGKDAGVWFICGGSSRSAALAIYPDTAHATVNDAVAGLRRDAGGQQLGGVSQWSFGQYRGQRFDVTVRSRFKFGTTGFDCLQPDGAGCPAGVKLRVGAVDAAGSIYLIYFLAGDVDAFDAYSAAASTILESIRFGTGP